MPYYCETIRGQKLMAWTTAVLRTSFNGMAFNAFKCWCGYNRPKGRPQILWSFLLSDIFSLETG